MLILRNILYEMNIFTCVDRGKRAAAYDLVNSTCKGSLYYRSRQKLTAVWNVFFF